MITSSLPSVRSTLSRTALFALGCALSLAPGLIAAARATDALALQPLAADKAPALPLTAAFEKGTGAEGAPYVLKLTNTSKEAVKVAAKVLLSVAFHADSKARNIPEHAIAAGATWSISDLAANDKVVISAKGFAPLELTVP
jgi:hypothetical protein